MGNEAVFFDLDRTLIASSSAPVFQRHLVAAGIAPDRDLPFSDLLMKQYEVLGENWLLMQPAKLAAAAAKGWNVDAVAEAIGPAADEIAEQLQPFADQVFAEHRAAGRKLVLATTSPYAFVKPLVDRLGFDAAIATKWKRKHGHYIGRTKGEFVWGRTKADAVATWARRNDCDLDGCWAYSDSFYDAPMLDLVGNPVAVNPDAQLSALAVLKGWPIRHLDKPEGVVKVAGREIQDWGRPLLRSEFFAGYARFQMHNLEHIPMTGPVIVAYNHRSYFDPLVVSLAMAQVGRPIRAMAKKELFKVPVIGQALRSMGAIEVDRGSGKAGPLEAARAALDAGEAVMIAPQGTIPRGPAFFDPVIEVRRGVVQLAHDTKAPVIPLGLWGTERIWPRSARGPKVSLIGRPTVEVRAGAPVELKYRSVPADAKRIGAAMSAALPAEAAEKRDPTEEELRRTYPPGFEPSSV